MTELLDYEAAPGVRFIRAWLDPLEGGAGAQRAAGEELPFTLIQRYDGTVGDRSDIGFYQFDHLAEATADKTAFTACEEYERRVIRRMLYLRRHPDTEVTVPGWGTATADRVRCVEHGIPVPYPDTKIARLVSRWEIHFSLTRIA